MYAPLESRIERVEKDYKEEHENTKNMFKKEINKERVIIIITQQILGQI